MSPELQAAAVELAREVPQGTLDRFAREVERDGGIPSLPGPAGSRLREVAKAWIAARGEASLRELALTLTIAARAVGVERERQRVDLVWTGPHGERFGLLRIQESLLDVIAAAQRHILIVTFAAYEVDAVRTALAGAADRGVSVTVVAEHAKEDGGNVSFDPLPHLLGETFLEKVKAYIWPAETRPTVEGRFGTLHVKTIVADDRELLVSSANFTGHALAINMELGVRVRGGTLPKRVREHFEDLMRTGVLRAQD